MTQTLERTATLPDLLPDDVLSDDVLPDVATLESGLEVARDGVDTLRSAATNFRARKAAVNEAIDQILSKRSQSTFLEENIQEDAE